MHLKFKEYCYIYVWLIDYLPYTACFQMFKEEIFNCTVLCNRFVKSLTTFIFWQKSILCQKFDHNPNSDRIKLEY